MKFNKSILILSIIFSSISNINAQANSKWNMLEDILVTQPYEQVNTIPTRSLRWLTSGISGAGVSKIAYDQLGNLTEDKKKRLALGIPIGLVSAAFINHLIYNVLYTHYEQNALNNFIMAWPENKSITPTELQPTFDQLYKLYKEDSEIYTHKVQQAERLIKIALNKQACGNNRPSNWQQSFFDSKVLQANVRWDFGSILNGVANIIRATMGR